MSGPCLLSSTGKWKNFFCVVISFTAVLNVQNYFSSFRSTVPYLFYRAKTSNYFHLHYDMTLPLFKFFEEYTKNIPASSVVLMPSVETTRLKVRI